MTAALVSAVNHLDTLPDEPGISPRAARMVLRVYAKIAQHDGSFRYGLRGSKVAALADYSLATVRRVQRYLVTHGFLEKVKVGGGRASTRWRIVLEKLGLRHSTCPPLIPQPSPPDTAQEHPPKKFSRMFSGWPRRDHLPGERPEGDTLPPSRAALAATPSGRTYEALALDWAAAAGTLVSEVCEHDSRAGLMRSGLPWCPDCRSQARRRRA